MSDFKIELPKGETLYVKDTGPDFLKKVREHFKIADDEEVSNDHIRMFIYGAFKSAIEKAETIGVQNVSL